MVVVGQSSYMEDSTLTEEHPKSASLMRPPAINKFDGLISR